MKKRSTFICNQRNYRTGSTEQKEVVIVRQYSAGYIGSYLY